MLEHYGITEATMGCPVRATMDVVQVGETLGLPVWLDRYAAEVGLVNRTHASRAGASRADQEHPDAR